jgi:hypothetical protein
MTPAQYQAAIKQVTAPGFDDVLSEKTKNIESLRAAREKAKLSIGTRLNNYNRAKKGLPPGPKDVALTEDQAKAIDQLLEGIAHPAWSDELAESLDSEFGLGWGANEGVDRNYVGQADYHDQANERAWNLVKAPLDYGPHTDEWHQDVMDAILRNGLTPAQQQQQHTSEPAPDESHDPWGDTAHDPWAPTPDQSSGPPPEDQPADELYDEAEAAVRRSNRASTAVLQRELGISHDRAKTLLDQLIANRVTGENKGQYYEVPEQKSDFADQFTARRQPGTFADLYSALFWATVERSTGMAG